ncbi:MAG: translocation/assembly module TamB [Flavobacteriales bacterium]|nr:translocation/assembly module TamB [Flavobacteriales bacterium]
MLRWIGILIGVAVGLFLLTALLLLWSPVQTRVVGWLSERASQELGTEVRIGRVALSLKGQLVLERLFVADLDADTLISAGSLRLKGLRVHPGAHLVSMTGFDLEEVRFRLRTPAGGTKSNLTLLLDRLGEGDTTSASDDWIIRCTRFNLDELHFTFDNENAPRLPFGVDFEHVGVTHAHIAGRGLEVIGDSITADLNRLRLTEQGGLQVTELSGRTAVSGKGILIQDLRLRTPLSAADGEMRFTTENWRDYNAFNEKVMMRVDLDTAHVDFADIALFAPGLEGIHYPMEVSGRIRGTIAELKGRNLRIAFGERSRFFGAAELSGLPDIMNTFMLLDIDELATDPGDLTGLPIPPFTSGEHLVLPAEVHRLGRIAFSGNFTGFLRAFTAYGRTTTQLGVLNTDMSYERDTVSDVFTIAGRVVTPGFDLGPLTGTSTLGPLAANLRLKATGRSLETAQADLEGTFPMITVNGRSITGITANGRLERNLFNGDLSVADEKLRLRFEGLADLRQRWPQVDFRAQVDHMDLHALGFVKTPGYNSLKMDVTAAGRFSPDSLLGSLSARDISYCVGDMDHELGDITLRSGRGSGRNIVELDADFASARVEGLFQPTHLPTLVTNTVFSVFPSLGNEVDYRQAEQQFTFTVTTRNSDAVLDLVLPQLRVAPGASVSGSMDSRAFDVDVSAQIPWMVYGDLRLDSVELMTEKTVDVLAFALRSSRQTYRDSMWFVGSELTGLAYQDEIELAAGWAGSNSGTNGHLDVQGQVRGLRSVDLDLLPSTLHLGRGNWRNEEVAHIVIDSSTVLVDTLMLENGVQRIAVSGRMSRDPREALLFALHDVDIANFRPLMEGPPIDGTVSGDGRLYDLYGTPYLESYLCADSVQVEDKPVGDIRFHADWSEETGSVALSGELTRGPLKALDFVGRMEPKQENKLDIDLVFDRFDLTFIDPYLPEGISDIQGTVTGTVDVSGDLAHPLVNGVVDLDNAGLRIDYLNTLYTFSNKVKIAPDMFALDLVTIRDEEGNTGRIGGTILHDGLRAWNFNVWGTVKNLMVLNTTVADNSLYYGKAFANGDVEVSGSVDQLEITVDASTGPGTDIHFPVGGSTEVSDVGFVRFVSSDSTATEEEVDLTGIALDLKARVTPDAHFELIFDPTIGDVMAGRGQGDMEMTVSQTGEFRMRGQVEVTEGDYLFTLRNVVNKRFEVVPGGRIVWYGDPLDAQLDIQAQYRVRAPLYDIMFEKNDAYKKRVPVDVVMQLRENLMNPEIGFEVRMPTVDDDIRTRVNSVLSTEQERNRQVFALIVLNRFIQPQSLAGSGSPGSGGNVVETTGFELLSNQVSNWLSKLSNAFDLGVNYRPGDNITQDELAVAMSTQLFNERLLLTTNVGVSTNAQNTTNNNGLIGDFQLEYLLTPEGRLRAKAFSVSNDRNLNRSDQAPTTQGAGVAYREEFRDWNELWQKLLNNFRPASKDRVFD